MAGRSFFGELRDRKVLQAAAIYVAVAWGVVEIVVTVVEQLFLPQWVATLAVIGFVVGFPVAMFLAWTFDITTHGIRRAEVSSRRGRASIALSMLMLFAGTAGLFLLIKPSIDGSGPRPDIVPNSVAVLPFENASQDDEDAYLSEGLSDELRDQLGRVAELRIAARSSSVAAVERRMDAIAASDSLRVAHLVEGSLRRQGNRLRVSVQLIEGRTGLAVWSETYERGTNELLSVQQTVADEVARRVLPEADELVTSPATRNADANELMILAQHYERRVRSRQEVDTDTLLEAIRLYREASEADPESALAHSRLAGALLYLGDIDAAEAHIFKALSLQPNLSEVQNTLGEFYWARGMPEANSAFRRAVELNPHNADALQNYAFIQWMSAPSAEIDGPAELLQRALEFDPLTLSRHADLGNYLGQNGRVDELLRVIQNIEAQFDDAEAYRAIGLLYQLSGDVDLAIAWTIRARDLEPDNPDHVARLADLYALIGDADTALWLESPPGLGTMLQLGLYTELIDAAEFRMIEEPRDVETRFLLAFAYHVTGNHESAIRILSSTGMLEHSMGSPRSVSEIEAGLTLTSALIASGIPEGVEIGMARAKWAEEEAPWWGDIGWVAVFRSCNFSLLGRHEEALDLLPRLKESRRLRYHPVLRDSWCFEPYAEHPVYLDVLRDQEKRRARIRERLPVTLSELGVEL